MEKLGCYVSMVQISYCSWTRQGDVNFALRYKSTIFDIDNIYGYNDCMEGSDWVIGYSGFFSY